MRGWFRRRPVLTDAALREEFDAFLADAKTALAWDLSLDQWNALTDFERKECRRLITTAPKFEVAS